MIYWISRDNGGEKIYGYDLWSREPAKDYCFNDKSKFVYRERYSGDHLGHVYFPNFYVGFGECFKVDLSLNML